MAALSQPQLADPRIALGSESAGGQVVFHLHVHVIPRKEGIALKPPATVKEAPDVLKEQAAKLASALA